ncbi:hypothetical protein EG329_003752 [Mollisiaceae sp. DMI_Dod_QoI]|nr:hypothetical protein EG329_003752 [Helotiales sp. DMI_Dod_QoI]
MVEYRSQVESVPEPLPRTASPPRPQQPSVAHSRFSYNSTAYPPTPPSSENVPFHTLHQTMPLTVTYEAVPARQVPLKKVPRAAVACDQCRNIKGRCDEDRPICGSCRERGLQCHFREHQRQSGNGTSKLDEYLQNQKEVLQRLDEYLHNQKEVLQRLDKTEDRLNSIDERWEQTHGRLNSIDERWEQTHGRLNSIDERWEQTHGRLNSIDERWEQTHGRLKKRRVDDNHIREHAKQLASPEQPPSSNNSPFSPSQSLVSLSETLVEESLEPSSITRNHTTGVARLLLIEPIAEINTDMVGPEYIEEWEKGQLLRSAGEEMGYDCSAETVRTLLESYKNHINRIHPVFVPSELDTLVSGFQRPNGQEEQRLPALVVHERHKRKRADDSEATNWKAIHVAIVLLAMSLGKICQHKGRIPNDIPGLEYFSRAMKALDNQPSRNTLRYAQAKILAGLYYGRLGRVVQSHRHIVAACRIVQTHLKRSIDLLKEVKENLRVLPEEHNPLVFAFWTCLKLESGIINELELPASGILEYIEYIPLPNMQAAVDGGFEPIVIESYVTHVCLQRESNTIIPGLISSKDPRTFPAVKASTSALSTLVSKLRWEIKWDIDKGEPAKDVLSAQLRAKYYSTQVIIHLPFVLNILEWSAGVAREDINEKVLQYAGDGVKALANSATAFDGLDPAMERPSATNIWVTAHTQWKYVLALLAAYRNPILSQFFREIMDEKKLQHILQRTMLALQLVAPALDREYRLLDRIGQEWGLLEHSIDHQNLSWDARLHRP